MRLIDADALMDDIYGALNQMTNIGIVVDGEWLWGKLNDALDNAPTVEPQRKHGRWIKENIVLTSNPPQFQWYCSECGKTMHGYSAEILTDFCPSCGAVMRGGQDE